MYSNLWSLALDGFILLIIVLCAWYGYKKGLIKMIVSLACYILSIIISLLLSKEITKHIITIISPTLNTFVENETKIFISSNTSVPIDKIYEQFPYIFEIFGTNTDISNMLSDSSSELSTTITQNLLIPTIQVLIQSVVFLVLFFLIANILKFIVRRLDFINKIPVIGSFNAVLGLVLGLVQSCIILILVVDACYLIVAFTGNTLQFLNLSVIDNSMLFKAFYNFSISTF